MPGEVIKSTGIALTLGRRLVLTMSGRVKTTNQEEGGYTVAVVLLGVVPS